jgi:WhiB family transcriptional regulator, redox-sensing transcriptional regulator
VFFPPPRFERKHERLAREADAKGICLGCDVREECLEYALSIREPHGIWGGLNENERKLLLAQRDDC